jgi:large repetitive protein
MGRNRFGQNQSTRQRGKSAATPSGTTAPVSGADALRIHGLHSSMLALEPRFVFDAALVVTAADALNHDDPNADTGHSAGHDDIAASVIADTSPAAVAEPGATPAGSDVRQIVFVDSHVRNYRELTAGLGSDTQVVVLEAARDGLSQISETLAGRRGIEAVHILSHGSDGAVMLGDGAITNAVVASRADEVAGWRDALTDNADILFYGCDIGGNEAGRALIHQIADLTGADVAASTDATGAVARGGDWELEYATGAIDAPLLSGADGYDGLLSAPDAGGDLTVIDPAGGAVSIGEDAAAPRSANIRLGGITLNDGDTNQPSQIRIVSVTGGTLTDSAGNPITTGIAGTALSVLNDGVSNYVDLRFTPAADRDTAASFVYRVIDAEGDADSADSTATVAITAVNDAPGAADATLTAIDEDVSGAANTGTSITTLVDSASYADADTGAQRGIAITGVSDVRGVWQYSTNGGTSWADIGGTRSDANALLLAADAGNNNRVRFVPEADYNGTATFTWRAWDQTSGASGASANIAASGGSTAFGDTARTANLTINPVNDTPVLDGSYTYSLPSIAEDVADADNTGTLVSDIVGPFVSANVARDADGDTLGIAITDTSGMSGTWQYSADGTSWTDMPALNAGEALPLAATWRVRFIPTADQTGSARFTFRFWDQSAGSGTSGTALDITGSSTVTGGFSSQSAYLRLPVAAVNDAPVLQHNSASVVETTVHTITAAELQVTDVDNTDSEQLIYRIESLATRGFVTKTIGGNDVVLPVGGLFSQKDVEDGLIKYKYNGSDLTADTTDSFTFSVRDGAGGVLGSGTVADPVKSFSIAIADVNAQIGISTTSFQVRERLGSATTDLYDGRSGRRDQRCRWRRQQHHGHLRRHAVGRFAGIFRRHVLAGGHRRPVAHQGPTGRQSPLRRQHHRAG